MNVYPSTLLSYYHRNKLIRRVASKYISPNSKNCIEKIGNKTVCFDYFGKYGVTTIYVTGVTDNRKRKGL
jgi:hypothetical protein